MSAEQQEYLRSRGSLMLKPDLPLQISSGSDLDWPDARGVFNSDDDRVAGWVNHEDHARFISTGPSANLKLAFIRLYTLLNEVEASLKVDGYEFIHDERLGFMTTAPENLGTALCISITMRLPLLASRDDFDKIIGMLRLQTHFLDGPVNTEMIQLEDVATWPVLVLSNPIVLGRTEVEVTNLVRINTALSSIL